MIENADDDCVLVLLDYLKKMDRLTQETKKQIIGSYLSQCEEHVKQGISLKERTEVRASGGNKYCLSRYLNAAILLDVSRDEQLKTILVCLNNTTIDISTSSFGGFYYLCKDIKEAGLMADCVLLLMDKFNLDAADHSIEKLVGFLPNIPEEYITDDLKEKLIKKMTDLVKALEPKFTESMAEQIKFHNYEQFMANSLLHAKMYCASSKLKDTILDPLISRHFQIFVDLLLQLPPEKFIERLWYPFVCRADDSGGITEQQAEQIKKYISDKQITVDQMSPVFQKAITLGYIGTQNILKQLLPEGMCHALDVVVQT
ncbi:hypothetical protein [Legionella israelensis]|nr:hypothetical protein [Legionella israelensis]QBS09748.1 hypothetical protein E4T55_07680 [Legionella israelensis]